MGIVGSILYVTDIDRVAQIDLTSGEIKKFYEVPMASFLNDIAVDKSGNVYVSDMMDTKIYRISADTIGLWLDDQVLTSPNGLFVQDDQLLIGCQKIVKAGLGDGKIQEWVRETGGIDGLEGTGDGSYLFSDWQGNVYLLNNEQKIEKLIDLNTEQKNAADIEFNPVDNILYVPTFGANTVIAYKLNH
jgi:sugar lactone lactonase YvrE